MSRKTAKTRNVAQPEAVAPHRDANAANAFNDYAMAVVLWLFGGGLIWYFELPLNFDLTDHDFNPILFVPAFFGLAGAYQFVRATFRTWRTRKFGPSTLEVGPATRGQKLNGTIRTPHDLAPVGDYAIILKCIRTTHAGSDTHSHYVDRLMWQETWTVPRDTVRSSVGIPFEFVIPSNMPPSRGDPVQTTTDGDIRWVLTASAPMPGLDYYAPFAITVR